MIDTISIPFDKGANLLGSSTAPEILVNLINNNKKLKINQNKLINSNNHITNIFSEGYISIWNSLNRGNLPIILGGDHSISISSIPPINEFCNMQNERLGILWCDAHADFNTAETSPSGNIHGMPVSVLCGLTLPSLRYGLPIETYKFGYYGLRDLDSEEFKLFQEHNMKILDSEIEINEWINFFDKIHISFDFDCLDPSEFNSVNTPVTNGKTLNQIINLFNKIKKSKKLISLDLVEYNPNLDMNSTQISILNNLLNNLF